MKSILITLLIFQSSLSFASRISGGISGGGGGTTNPSPVSQARVVTAVEKGAGPILAWMKGAQTRYFLALRAEKIPAGELGAGMGDADKALLAKLFAGSKSILDVFADAKIEIRSTEPCYDADHWPWDGSIYANKAGAVCVSSFAMAPKLNERNVDVETMALIIHELSHLLGTTEAEAQAIQNDAIRVLSKVDLADYDWQMIGLENGLQSTIKVVIKEAIARPKNFRGRFIEPLWGQTSNFLQMQSFRSGNDFALLSFPTRMAFNGYGVLVTTIQDAACLFDTEERPEERKNCLRNQWEGFRNKKSIPARTYLSQSTGLPEIVYADPEYDLIVSKISNENELRAALTRYLGFIEQVEVELRAQTHATYEIIRN